MGRMLKAVIDCTALKENLETVRKIAKHQKVIAMVKANGYGHGLITAARALQSADALGVACIEEAIILRENGIKNRIVLMEGFFNAQLELPEIIRLNLEPVLHHEFQVESLISYFKNSGALKSDCNERSLFLPLKIWLKLNTGMNRLGFFSEDFLAALHELAPLEESNILQIEGYLTHFSAADQQERPETALQIQAFFSQVKALPGAKSLANSAGILGWPESHADWVRPGIMLYGISPFPERIGVNEGLKPVMSLSSELISIQPLKKGDAVGYGGSFIAKEDMRIGVVAIGYGDGYPRLATFGTPVLVNGKPTILVGRVSMDMITVDLTLVQDAKVGDAVELWGKSLPAEIVANAIGTSAYELLTGLTERVKRFEIA